MYTLMAQRIIKNIPRMLGVFGLGSLAICIYGHIRCKVGFRDPLSIKLNLGDLDIWSLTHLGLFAMVGYMFPGAVLGIVAFACGVMWEITEHFFGKSRAKIRVWGHCPAAEFQNDNTSWWFGQYSDIIVNGMGLLLGNVMRNGV